MAKSSDTGLFQNRTPRLDLCCLCSHPDVAHMEQRPSGSAGTWQKWAYCETCWQASQGDDHNVDPAAWKVFIMFILQIDPRRGRDETGKEKV